MKMTGAKSIFTGLVLISVVLFIGCQTGERYFLTDEQGRALVFHGANISNAAKYDPLHVGWHQEADYNRMVSWGMNCVRLLIFWAAIEPAEGVFDDTYLDRVQERLDWAASAGLRVILDMHQDLYGEKFSGGDGAPVWATRDEGIPYTPVSPWGLNYLSPAVTKAFHHFWYDADLREDFMQAWIHVVQRFKDHPAVLGYEILNEPYFGDTSLFSFEQDVLYPFYRYITDGIRSVDPQGIIFFEPMIITSAGLPSFGDPIGIPSAVYSAHFYQLGVHDGSPYNGDPSTIINTMNMRRGEASKHGTPWMLTEFGVAPTTSGYDLYLRDILNALDQQSAGWCYYTYDKASDDSFGMVEEDGSESPVMEQLVRPYPQRTAGSLKSYGFDPSSKTFQMTFDNKSGVSGDTEIFAAASRVYGGSFQIQSSDPAGTWSYTFDPANEIVHLTTDPLSSEHVVTIHP